MDKDKISGTIHQGKLAIYLKMVRQRFKRHPKSLRRLPTRLSGANVYQPGISIKKPPSHVFC